MTRPGFAVACGTVGWLTALLAQVLLVCLAEPPAHLTAEDLPAVLLIGGVWWVLLALASWWLARFVRPAAERPSPVVVAFAVAVSLGATVAGFFLLLRRLAPDMAEALGPAAAVGFFAPQLVAAWMGAWVGARPRRRSDVQRPPADQR